MLKVIRLRSLLENAMETSPLDHHRLPIPLRWLHRLLKPKSTSPRNAFRERAMRLTVLIALVFFTAAGFVNLEGSLTPRGLLWYSVIYALCTAIILLLDRGKVRLASVTMSLAIVLLVLDETAEYWSPGTIVLSLMFTFLFQIIMVRRRDMLLAVIANLGIYGWLVMFPSQPAPLDPVDYFASPLSAMLTLYAAHFVIIGVTLFIRHEQRTLDCIELDYVRMKQEQLQFALNKERELSELKSRMMIRIMHEFRTPLTTIQMTTEMLDRYLERYSNEQRQQKTALVRQEIENITTMLDAISDVVNNRLVPEELLLRPLDLSAIVRQSITELEAQYGFGERFVVETAGSTTVRGDTQLLQRMMKHILHNAAQFTPQQHTIRIVITTGEDRVHIQVIDRGIGIAPQEQAFIFEPFFRGVNIGEVGGLGLGLTIAQAIVLAHNGAINIRSTLDEGTTVELSLPRTTA